MIQIDDQTLAELQKHSESISLRVLRLQEWIELTQYVQKLANSFGQLHVDVQQTLGEPPSDPVLDNLGAVWPRFRGQWQLCRDAAFLELEIFMESIEYIHLPDADHVNGGSQEMLWFTEITQMKNEIEDHLLRFSVKPFRDRCFLLRSKLQRESMLHQNLLKKEIVALRQASLQFHVQLDRAVEGDS